MERLRLNQDLAEIEHIAKTRFLKNFSFLSSIFSLLIRICQAAQIDRMQTHVNLIFIYNGFMVVLHLVFRHPGTR